MDATRGDSSPIHPWALSLLGWIAAFGLVVLLGVLLISHAGFHAEQNGSGCKSLPHDDEAKVGWRLWIVGFSFGTWVSLGIMLLARSTRWLTGRPSRATTWRLLLGVAAATWGLLALLSVRSHDGWALALLWLLGAAITLVLTLVAGLTALATRDAPADARPTDGPARPWLVFGWLLVVLSALVGAWVILFNGPLNSVMENSLC
jgi:hypothetical protein